MYVIQYKGKDVWDLKVIDVNKSLYLSIADALERDIKAGVLKPGQKMPTHRELAKKVGVTLTTATRAYREAERRGLVTAVVGNGTFVTSDLGFNSSLINTEAHDSRLIEMGLVFPLYSVEPGLREVIDRVLAKSDLRDFMKYSPPQGLLRHRQAGARWVKRFGLNVGPDRVLVTAGAQLAINCIFSSAFEPEDRIAVDGLTYPGVKSAARRCGVRLEGVPLDEEGMIPRELEALCNRHRIKGVYTVACLQNPTNACMSETRRRELAEIVKKYDLLLIEDDLYGFLPEKTPPALSALLPENSVYIAGLSKAFYAGLRVGFIVPPPGLFNSIAQGIIDLIWMAPPICAEIACEAIASGAADKVIRQRRREIGRRAALLHEKLAGFAYKYAEHSMYAWVSLPERWSSAAFELAARENGVNVVGADKFTVGSLPLPNCFRLSITGAASYKEFARGLGILAGILKGESGPVSGIM